MCARIAKGVNLKKTGKYYGGGMPPLSETEKTKATSIYLPESLMQKYKRLKEKNKNWLREKIKSESELE